MSLRRISLLLLPLMLLSGCGTGGWFGKAGDPILEGTRVPVIVSNSSLAVDQSLADVPQSLPPVINNAIWPQSGGIPTHALGHLGLSGSPKIAWTADAGEGSSKRGFLVHAPVVSGGRVLVMDTRSRLRAFSVADGKEMWETDLNPEDEDRSVASGGIAIDGDIVYAATGQADLYAVSITDGKILWRQPVSSPMRAAPTVSQGRVLITTVDNKLLALTVRDGSLLWTYEGINETASLLSEASPAVDGGIVAAPFSSGDLIGLRLDNGRQVWQESLFGIRRGNAMSMITAISANPVIYQNTVYAIGHSGRMVGIDLNTGSRRFELAVGGTQMPWIAGDYIYLISNGGELICLTLYGKAKWIKQLPVGEGKERITYAGPVLAGEKLWVVASDGRLLGMNPGSGDVIQTVELPGDTAVAPVVAQGTLFILTNNGRLVALR